MMILRNTKEMIVEIVIDSNWYLIYSSYKWWTRTNVFKSSLYNFIGKSKIDIRNGGKGGIFETLKEKQDYK